MNGLLVLLFTIGAEDVAQWPYTPGLLVEWVAFLGSLHWPAGGVDLGVGGISYVELLILCELWAGERLTLEKAHPRYLRPERPISVSAGPFGPGIDIWRSCHFIGAMMTSLSMLPGGLDRFVPCSHRGPCQGTVCWLAGVGLCLAILVLIIGGFGMLVGRGVVMGLLLGLGKVLLEFFSIGSCCYFNILLCLLVRCLLGLFLFGTVLPGLLVRSPFELCQFLVMLLG